MTDEEQHARLREAMLELTVKGGFPAITVELLCTHAGVSQASFHRLFKDLEACFLASYEEILDRYLGSILDAYEDPLPWDQLLRGALSAMLEAISQHPEQAHLVIVDSLSAGPRAVRRNRQLTATFQTLFSEHARHVPGPNRPSTTILRGIAGGIREVVFNHVAAGRAPELPKLIDPIFTWALSYLAQSPVALEREEIRYEHLAEPPREPPGETDPDFRGEVSLSSHTTTLLAEDWPRGVHVGLAELLQRIVELPDHRHAALVDALSLGPPPASPLRRGALDCLATLLAGGYAAPTPDPPSAVAGEAIGGAILEVLSEEVLRGRAEQLREVLPFVTYMALAPFIGPERAARVAVEDPI